MGISPSRRQFLEVLTAGAGIAAFPSLALAADTYPSRTVKIVAPVQPGGGVDLVARTMAERLTKALNQSFIVENLSGGGGVIASQAVARAAPDGYTLMLGYVGTHGTNPAVRKLPYDAVNGFTPISMVAGTPNVLVVNPQVPAKTFQEFIAYAKANPGKLSYGSAGTGTLTHLLMEQMKEATGTYMVHVSYRGIGPSLLDLMAGQTQAAFPGLAAALPHIHNQKVRPLAVTGLQRHKLLPDVPTMQELGYQGFDGVQWYGIVAPANLPADITALLHKNINDQLSNAELKQRLSGEALEVMPMSQQEFADYIKNDIAKWSRLVQARHIHIE